MIVRSKTANAQCYKQEVELDWKSWCPERGSIILVNFGDEKTNIDSEIKNIRPAVVLSNNMGNRYSSILSVAPLTSSTTKTRIPVHVHIGIEEGLRNLSLVCLEQTVCISKRRALIDNKFIIICELSEKKMKEIDKGLMIQMGLI